MHGEALRGHRAAVLLRGGLSNKVRWSREFKNCFYVSVVCLEDFSRSENSDV